MNDAVQNIIGNLSVRLKRKQTFFIRTGQVFFGFLFLLFFQLNANAQTGTITANNYSVCQGGNEPIITFAGTGNPEYTFTYGIDNGTTQSTLVITTINGASSVDLPVPTAVPGSYTYTLQQVTDVNNNTTVITGQSVTIVVNPLPTPTITASGPTTFRCPRGTVTLSTSAPPPGSSYTYQWVRVSDLSNDTIDIVDSTDFDFIAKGGYGYAVRVTDNNGCVAVSDTIRVLQLPPPQFLSGAHNSTAVATCLSHDPGLLFFTSPVSGGVGPYNYQWQFSSDAGVSWNDISGETGNSYDPPNLNLPGSYSYRALISDACGEILPTTAKTITINGLPTVACPIDFSVCIDAPTFPLTSATPAGGTYTGTGVGTGSFSPAIAGEGPHLITYTYTDGNNCINSCAFTITVNPIPTVTCPANSSVCINATPFALTGATPAGGVYSGQGVSSGNFNPATAGAGPHTITYTYTNANNCVNTCAFTITVNDSPVPTITGSPTACLSSTGNIYSTESGMSGYTWTVSAGGTITAGAGTSSIIVSWTTIGAKTVTVNYADANGCNATTATSFPVTVNTNPTAFITGATSFCDGGSVLLSAATSTAGSGTITGYQWNLSGIPIIGATSSTYPATVAGNYTVTVTNSNNCSNTSATRSVTVIAAPTITLGTNPSICRGIATANLTYSAVSGTPNQYSIDYDATANAANFTDITNAALPSSQIVLTVPGAAPAGIYNAILTVRNSTTGCISNSYPITVTVNARPVPTITGSPTACLSSTGNIYSTESGMSGYTWTASAGGTITAGAGTNSITVSWSTIGAKTVTVNYTNVNGCNATTATSFLVAVNTNPTALITGATSFCAGGTVILSATTSTAGSGTITGYQWNLSGIPIIGATSSTYPATVAGNYTVTVTNSNNCSNTSAIRAVTVIAVPTITLGTNPSICRGIATANLTYSAVSGTPNQYSIDYDAAANAANFADITNAALPSSQIVLTVPAAAPAGIYNAILTVRNSTTGCISNSYPITVTVNARPVPTISGSPTACLSSTGNIYSTESGMSGYTWTVSAGGTITAGAGTNSITVSWTTIGAKTITVNYTNVNGCNATTATSFPVTVNALPAIPTISAGGPTVFCQGGSVTLTSSSATGNQWSLDGTPIAGATNQTYSATINGNYTVTVTNASICSRTSAVRAVTVNPLPNVLVATPAAFCSGSNVTLTATGANTYSWSPSTGLSVTTGSTVIATPETTTTYTITGTNTTTGCINSTTVTVTVIQGPTGDMSSQPPVCYGINNGTITLTNYTGTILRWESSINAGTTWTTISGTDNNSTTSVPYSNLTQTTIYRAALELNGCQGYSSTGIIPVSPLFVPTVTATPPIICLGQSAVLTASDYGQPPLSLEDFQNANPAGWSGNEANNNNQDPNSDWGESAQSGKVFNGIPYNSNAPPLSTKFMIVTGTTDGSDRIASLITAPFSLAGTINPVFNYWTALNFNAGTTGLVEISTDGGTSYNTLKTYTGPVNVGNPNMGWTQEAINLSAYIGQANVRVRFNYTGTAGSNWAVDNVGIATTFQPVTYQWSPTTYLNPASGNGKTVTATPTTTGTFPYCVVATSAAGCVSPPVCVDVVVNPLPTCSISGAGPVCPGSSKVYSGPAIAGYSYTWTISGAGSIAGSATGQTVTVIANNSCGTYTLTLQTTLNGCAGTPCAVTVSVVDNESPAWTTTPGFLNRSVACGDATALTNAQALSPVASDNCGNITYQKISGTLTGGTCGGTYTNTWTATDACNNTSTIFTQVITITDILAPTLTGTLPGGAQGNICLAAAPAAPNAATIASLYTDDCATVSAILTNTITTGNNCSWTVTYTYTVTDGCNPITVNVVYTGGDTQAPVITSCPVTQTLCIAANGMYTIPALIAADNCSGALNITFQVTGATTRNGIGNDASGIFNPGTSTITWTVMDACGNTATCTTLVTVSPKPTPIIYHN